MLRQEQWECVAKTQSQNAKTVLTIIEPSYKHRNSQSQYVYAHSKFRAKNQYQNV